MTNQPTTPRGVRRRALRAAALAWSVAIACSHACRDRPADQARDDAALGRRSHKPVVVVVSVAPQAYVVERVAGDRVRIVVLIPPGAAPDTFEPGMPQVRALGEADLYLMVGHPAFAFERAWIDNLLQGNAAIRIVDAHATMPPATGLETPPDDPHNWVSPGSVRQLVPRLAEALVALLPDARAALEANRDALLSDIDALDREWRAGLAHVPGRAFFTVHEAWGYLAAEYGLEQIAIEHGANKPGPRELQALVADARRRGARVIMAQQQFDPATAKLLAAELGGDVVTVDPLARDWLANMRALLPIFERALVP